MLDAERSPDTLNMYDTVFVSNWVKCTPCVCVFVVLTCACVDYVSDGGTPGSTVLSELTRRFHPALSPSCVAEDSRSGDRFRVGLDRGCPRLQLASSSSAPLARRCGKEKAFDQITVGTSCGMSKPAEPSLHKQYRYVKHICLFYEETPSHGPIPPIVRMARWPKTPGE